MKQVILFTLILISELASGQQRTGVYLIFNVDISQCQNRFKVFNGEAEFCLSNESAIKFEDFAGVSDIYFHPTLQKRSIDIYLTAKGSKRLQTIISKLGYREIALVINGKLVTVININGPSNTKSILIWDRYDTNTLGWIHRSLAKNLPTSGDNLKLSQQ
ncbi:hypothetical protein QQ020_03815 [Fulvivirgaceae bacterium BMA12]|uniref:SH3b domain-containing protein n=1 Tax=Agaribacillus aureus TaxID=3051825 RepID=A0ABT8L1L1_9BACT|nr:hypothetical protein [Fulvivirgaceae bacterium BMA12]